jgi:predicted transcriptional regulator
MTSHQKIAALTVQQCQALINSKFEKNGEMFYINPITKREVRSSASTFRSIEKHCKTLLQQDYKVLNTDSTAASRLPKARLKDILVEKWLQNPLQDPKKEIPIEADINPESIYAKWYVYAYKNGYVDKLPKNHLLFGSIDILLYRLNKTSFSHDDMIIYDFVERVIKIRESATVRYIIRTYGNHNKYSILVIYELVRMYAHAISNYINFVMKLIHSVKYKIMDKYVAQIKANFEDIDFIQAFNNNYDTAVAVESLFRDIGDSMIPNNAKYEYNYASDFKHHILNSDNCFQKVRDYYEEILNIYNYLEEPAKSPFQNLENKQFKEIDDPLISILKKIGIENINLATLELPKRPFDNDDEYNKYLDHYNTLKSHYNTEIKTWKESNMQSTPPKRPTMILPSKRMLNVTIEAFPRYIKDTEYNQTLNIYTANKKTIDMYKELIDLGILDLLNRAGIVENSPNGSKKGSKKGSAKGSIESSWLVNKDRDYFENHVLDIGDDNREKCNSNTDAISQDDFDDAKYPLAKLQLMFTLQKKNDQGDVVRTDCFYAPNFYNYVVNRINAKEPILNPLTKESQHPVSEKDIERLLKIMKVVVPDIEKPEFLAHTQDTKLRIQHREEYYRDKPFYIVSINRKIGDIDFEIYQLCSLPADIDVTETGSTDIASTVFLFNLYKLFSSGRLMTTYMPPYFDEHREYIKLENIHFNNYRIPHHWNKKREKQIDMFKHYLDELKGFL